jgi:hypothetical protein
MFVLFLEQEQNNIPVYSMAICGRGCCVGYFAIKCYCCSIEDAATGISDDGVDRADENHQRAAAFDGDNQVAD